MDYLIHHLLRTSAVRFPDKEALVHGAQRLTYHELAEQTAALAQGLRDAGLARDDRVGVFLEPSVPQVLAIFGVSQAGGIFVPIHQSLKPQQVAHIVNDCTMTALITSESKLAELKAVLDEAPSLRFLIVVKDGEVKDGEAVDVDRPTLAFDELIKTSAPEIWKDVAIEADLGAILYTSGSTGKPKGVMLSHANVMAGASIVSAYLEITNADRILAVLPFSFDAGLNQLTTAVQQGGTLVLMRFLFANDVVRMLKREEITGLAGVPSLWSLLAQPSSKLKETDLPRLRYITNTGGVLPQTVLAVLRDALPPTNVVLMYGLTEAFRSTYLPPDELDRRPGSMGKAIPNTEIFVIDKTGRLCAPGEVGELVHHGPTVSMGYWGHPELTKRLLRPHPFPPAGMAEGVKVCYSGDLVKKDEDGYLFFVGRRDGLIKSSGFRISPTEVEEMLCKSCTVKESAVIGIPDDVLGQSIKAFVVPGEGASLVPDDLLAACSSSLPRHMVPKSVEVLETLPKTSSGKIDYPALRRREGL